MERSPAVQALLWQHCNPGGEAVGGGEICSGASEVVSRAGGEPPRFDLEADPALRALAQRAIATGEMAVSGRLATAPGDSERPVFLVLQPVERAGALTGIVGAAFLFDELASASIGLLESRGVACRLRDL